MTDILVTDTGFAAYQPASAPWLIPVDEAITDDVSALLATEIIHIPFASSADGRGFSTARQLRIMGYQGQIFAIGALVCDQYRHARQSGFDGVLLTPEQAQRMPELHWLEQAKRVKLSYKDRLYT